MTLADSIRYPDHRKYQEDRQLRDIAGKNSKTDFVDRQLEKAKDYLSTQLSSPADESESKPEKAAPEESPKEKSAATSFHHPLFMVPKSTAG